MSPRVVRSIQRPAPDVIDALRSHGVATVHEANRQQGLLDLDVRLPGPQACVCGPAVTSLNHAGDNLMLHAALEVCRPGDVLVVATTSPSRHGMFGELLATICRARRIAGVVLDAGVRDAAAIRAMGYPVWARAVCAQGTTKTRAGWVNVPVVCAGVSIRPGDVVVADEDGVVAVAAESAEEVVAAAARRAAREAEVVERYRRGELSLDVNGLRRTVEDLGVVYM